MRATYPVALFPGTRLGAHEVTATLGEGGMGAVYRACDTKLNRDVALKVLLPEVANDLERLARFRREAQVLASLNHPHIGAIHGLEESPSTGAGQAVVIALVLELVEGPTLADRIARGAPFRRDGEKLAQDAGARMKPHHSAPRARGGGATLRALAPFR